MFCLLSFVYLFTKPSLLKSYVWMRFLLHTCTLTETVKVAKQLQVSSDHESLKIIYRLYTMLSMHVPLIIKGTSKHPERGTIIYYTLRKIHTCLLQCVCAFKFKPMCMYIHNYQHTNNQRLFLDA